MTKNKLALNGKKTDQTYKIYCYKKYYTRKKCKDLKTTCKL